VATIAALARFTPLAARTGLPNKTIAYEVRCAGEGSRRWPAISRSEVRDLLAWHPAIVDFRVIEQDRKIQDRYQLSFWDALIVAAAKSLSCRFLLTEDLQADQDFEGVLVVNPFVSDPSSLTARSNI
jgi:predicted nucleic acid-binding protein